MSYVYVKPNIESSLHACMHAWQLLEWTTNVSLKSFIMVAIRNHLPLTYTNDDQAEKELNSCKHVCT